MSLPRRVLPFMCHLVTRRCSERRFFLKPSKAVNEIVRYALAVAAAETGVELYAAMVEANHLHLVVGDPEAELSEFMQRFDQLVARALNARYGRGENFWSSGKFSNAEIHDEETLIRKLLYAYTNPVKDGLVERPEQWPGVKTLPEDMGALKQTVARPKHAFFGGRRPEGWIPRGALKPSEVRKAEAEQRLAAEAARRAGERPPRRGSTLPAQATLELKLPALAESDREDFVRRVREALEQELQRIYQQRRAAGKSEFMGVGRIRALDPFASAGDTFPRFQLDPRIASGNQDGERQALLDELKAWRYAYKAALEEWRNGNRAVTFPLGTYHMRKVHECTVGEVRLIG